MPNPGGDKLCPICDSPLQPGSKKCSFCGTDLTIFDIEVEAPPKVETPATASEPPPKVSVDSRVNEIFTSRATPSTPAPSSTSTVRPTPPPIEEEPKPEPLPEPVPEPAPEPVKVPEKPKAPEAPKVEKPETEDTFECPSCQAQIPVSASVCPKCGVMFAEEGAEMFQCPACNTLVSMDAKACPGCGAVFVESEEQATVISAPSTPAAVEAPSPPVKADIEPPIEEAEAPTPAAKAKEPDKKKGGWFKWGKKEEPKPEPKVEKIPPAPTVPKKPTEAVREVRPAERAPLTRQAAPEPVRPAPAPFQPTLRPSFGTSVSSSQDKGEQLARMVAEWKPLFALAGEKEINPGESKQLIDEAIIAGRERQVDRAIELVKKSKSILIGKIDARLSEVVGGLNEEIKVARDFGGDISRCTTYMQEITRARNSGDIEAAYVYAEKVKKELLPITGRYNEAKTKIADVKRLIQDCEAFIVDTKDARRLIMEASKAFELKDFDKVDGFVKSANDSLFKAIPARMTEEMKTARERLIDAKAKNVNITPMLTILKSTMSLLKSGDYPEAVREMRDFNELMKKVA